MYEINLMKQFGRHVAILINADKLYVLFSCSPAHCHT